MPLNINGEFFDPILGMTVPTTTTPGDLYAQDISNDLIFRVAPHTHTGVNNLDGYQLNTTSLNLTNDLTLNGNNLISIRSLQLQSNTAVLSGVSDVNNVYVVNGNLYYNNKNGTPIQLTNGNQINISSFATLAFALQAVNNANWTILPTDNYNALDVSCNTSALSITLPIASLVTAGRFYYIKDILGSSATNNITVKVTTGSGNTIDGLTSLVISGNFDSMLVYTDGANKWFVSWGSRTTFRNVTLALQNTPFTLDSSSTVTIDSNMNFSAGSVANFQFGSLVNLSGDVFAGAATLTGNFDLGSGLTITGPLNLATGTVIQGTATVGTGLSLTSGTITLSGTVIKANTTGAITATASQAIQSNTANGVVGTVTNAIVPTVAQGISDGGITGGIALTATDGLKALSGGGARFLSGSRFLLDAGTTATCNTALTVNGAAVLTGGFRGTTGLPLFVANEAITLTSGGTTTLGSIDYGYVLLLVAGTTLSATTYLDLGGAPTGTFFFIDTTKITAPSHLNIRTGGGTAVAISGSNSLVIAIATSATTVAVLG